MKRIKVTISITEEAYEILSNLPKGVRSYFVSQAIIHAYRNAVVTIGENTGTSSAVQAPPASPPVESGQNSQEPEEIEDDLGLEIRL